MTDLLGETSKVFVGANIECSFLKLKVKVYLLEVVVDSAL